MNDWPKLRMRERVCVYVSVCECDMRAGFGSLRERNTVTGTAMSANSHHGKASGHRHNMAPAHLSECAVPPAHTEPLDTVQQPAAHTRAPGMRHLRRAGVRRLAEAETTHAAAGCDCASSRALLSKHGVPAGRRATAEHRTVLDAITRQTQCA
jgi:hypothetical protein